MAKEQSMLDFYEEQIIGEVKVKVGKLLLILPHDRKRDLWGWPSVIDLQDSSK